MSNLSILETSIRTFENLYSLKDLHIASGNEKKHEPNRFIRLDTTKDLVKEIESENPNAHAVKTIRGTNGGTYASEELVIAYAMWISPKFHLVVLRAFLDMHRAQPKQLELPAPETTTDERKGLRDAVAVLVAKKGLIYSEVYQMIHQQFNVTHIDELNQPQLSKAIYYVHCLTTNLDELFQQGEYIRVPTYIFDGIMKHAHLAQRLADRVKEYMDKQFALLGIDRFYRHNSLTASANSLQEFSYFLREGNRLLEEDKQNPKLTQIK